MWDGKWLVYYENGMIKTDGQYNNSKDFLDMLESGLIIMKMEIFIQ